MDQQRGTRGLSGARQIGAAATGARMFPACGRRQASGLDGAARPINRLVRKLIPAADPRSRHEFFCKRLGDGVRRRPATIKGAEIARFMGEVMDREQREYFEMY